MLTRAFSKTELTLGSYMGMTYNFNKTHDAWCSTNEVLPLEWMEYPASPTCLDSYFVFYSNTPILLKTEARDQAVTFFTACDEDY
jgi:hypothetical protein